METKAIHSPYGVREAQLSDIPAMHRIRLAVKENILSDPSRVTEADYGPFLTHQGKGWVAEVEGQLVGFSILNLPDQSVWALFVDPPYEGRGIGSNLLHALLAWHFGQGGQQISLSTDANTRAEAFYRKQGWQAAAPLPNGEIPFLLSRAQWRAQASSLNR